MVTSLISNPPFNQRWKHPLMVGEMPAYQSYPTPPENNANYAFILKGLSLVDNKAAYILPLGALSTQSKAESAIRKALIERNLLSAVVGLPGDMFESTSIPICILFFDKHKETSDIWFFDLREHCEQMTRDQRGQFGGAAHAGRVYHKTFNIVPDEVIETIAEIVNGEEKTCDYGKRCSIDEVRKAEYILTPSRYVSKETTYSHRSYDDIIAQLDGVNKLRNAVKVTINETAAHSLGWDDLIANSKESKDNQVKIANICEQLAGIKLDKEDYLATSRSAIIRIDTKETTKLPQVINLALSAWKSHIIMCNEMENVLAAELRDALLNDLMTGKLEIDENGKITTP